jgi:hypothetical protein
MNETQETQRQTFVVRVWRSPAATTHGRAIWRAHVQDVETGQITLLETPGQMVDYFLGHTEPSPPTQGLK